MKVLVYGDFTLDRYTKVSTIRGCPERPEAPVYDVIGTEREALGCAGNTLENVLALRNLIFPNTAVKAMGLIGIQTWKWATDRSPPEMLSRNYLDLDSVQVVSNDIIKDRLVLDGKIVCRIDSRRDFGPATPSVGDGEYDLVIISDYGFGSVSPAIAAKLIEQSRVSVVDSKREDLSMFRGATIYKPNLSEWNSRPLNKRYDLMSTVFQYCVVSTGADGCVVYRHGDENGYIRTVPGFPEGEVDVTGCGDTFTASLGLHYAAGYDIIESARRSNFLASGVVKKLGPATPTYEDILDGKNRGIL